MQNYLQLISLLKKYKKSFCIAVGAMLIASLFRVFELSLLVPLVDRIFNNRQIIVPNQIPPFLADIIHYLNNIDSRVLFKLMPFVVLIGMLVKHAFIYFYQYLINDITQKIIRDLRQKLYIKLQSLSLDYFSKRKTGELMSRITYDVGIINNAVSYSVTDLFVQSFTLLGFFVTVFTIHFKAALVIFFVFPMIIFPLVMIGRKLRKLSKSSQQRMADINTILLETISGVRVVKAFSTEEYEIDRFRHKNHDFYKLAMKRIKRLLLLPPITELFGAICGIIMILWLGKQVMDGALSFGIFMLFFACIMSTINPIKKLGNVNAVTQQALSANERIHEVLEEEPTVKEKPQAIDIGPIRNEISLKDVTFSYSDTDDWVLRNINLDINVGQLVAIVGPTGTGKSTLVNLIPRFYDPQKGTVGIDGMDLREVTFKSLRSQIGIVSQETFLFNDTVKANIAYGNPNVPQDQIERAAQQAYAHRFIVQMPQQYNTIIGDRGFRLSGGEKQRIAIARAIVKNAPILILDEATSQLDSESERFVQEALDKLMQDRTVIAIAHRLSTIRQADKIIVLELGQIVGQGKHEELLVSCSLYKRLYETQFQM